MSRVLATRPGAWAGCIAAASVLISCGSIVIPPARELYSQEQLNALAQHPPLEDQPQPVAAPMPMESHVAPREAPPNEPPELVRRDIPATVVSGREVYFGIDVVDEDLDPVRVELTAKPEGAEVDPRTLTVRWRVPRTMTGEQTFTVKLTERPGAPDERVTERSFTVNVARRAPRAAAASGSEPNAFVPVMVTVVKPEYLARVQREWPVDKLLEAARDMLIDHLPEAQRAGMQRPAGRELFNQLLAQYAQINNNPRLDPGSPQFDRRFEPARWRLVAVRPRLNRQIHEIRLAYQAVDVPEPNFIMFRFRFFHGIFPPNQEVVAANNAAFTRLYHQAFFNGSQLKPGIAQGRAPAVAAAVSQLVRSVLTYNDPQNHDVRVGLAAIAQEARMGGGSEFDAEGNYVVGNAWAFSVAKLDPENVEGGGRTVRLNQAPISSFTFDLGPTPAGDAFTSVCPPRFRNGEPGLRAMCFPQDGTVRIPERTAEGRWVPARRDAMHEHREITQGEMLERIPLRDPRRRNFEEQGMTCVQCHIRNFDDGVMSELQVSDPRNHDPITPSRQVERIPMQILPIGNVPRAPWFVQQETYQVCDIKRDLHTLLNVDVELPCPDGY